MSSLERRPFGIPKDIARSERLTTHGLRGELRDAEASTKPSFPGF